MTVLKAEDVEPMMEAAWKSARASVHDVVTRAQRAASTPAMQAAGPNATQRELDRHMTAFMLEHLYATELALAVCTSSGLMTGQDASIAITFARDFVQGANAQIRCYCTASPCDWRGTLEDGGPIARCPKCNTPRVLVQAPVVAPAGAVPPVATPSRIIVP